MAGVVPDDFGCNFYGMHPAGDGPALPQFADLPVQAVNKSIFGCALWFIS